MVSNLPIRFAMTSEDVRPLLDSAQLTDTVRYFSNHVRNGGQAILYTQIANLALNAFVNDRKEQKGKKETGLYQVERHKDYSVGLGTLCFAGNYAFEATFGATNGNPNILDTHDILWVGLGAATLILWNKTSEIIAHYKFPQKMPETDTKPVFADPAP